MQYMDDVVNHVRESLLRLDEIRREMENAYYPECYGFYPGDYEFMGKKDEQ